MISYSINPYRIFEPDLDFEKHALEVFRFQATYNAVYAEFLNTLKINPDKIKAISEIPFLPIQLFKSLKIISIPETRNLPPSSILSKDYGGQRKPETIFRSSGTTGTEKSKHHVQDLNLYEKSFLQAFEFFYGNIEQICLLAVLPSYSEQQDSSLIFMTEKLIRKTKHELSGFYHKDFEKLDDVIRKLIQQRQKFILLGVTYSLLDFAEWLNAPLEGISKYGIIMETGGMKGRRREMVRKEVHDILKSKFGVNQIHSEYGMTELLSQAYSKGNGIFRSPPWMRVFISDINDRRQLLENGKTGGINIVDLANIYSCSFIATEDLGRKNEDGSFIVLGRYDNSDMRGCNLILDS